jgi:O-antigen/teichoic acid export membrane protein
VETLSNNFQTVLLGALSTVFNVGVFSLSSQIGLIGSMFHSSVGTAAMPLISALHDRKDMSQLKILYQTASKWTFTINLPLFLGVVLFSREILSIFGEAFEQGAVALVILSWANLVAFGTGTSGGILDMTGYSKLKFFNSLVATSTTLILNLWLIRSYGLLGAAVATLVAAALINFLRMGEVFHLYRMLPYNVSFLKPILAGLVALVVGLLTRRWIPEANNYLFIINISILMAVYFLIIFLLGLSAEDQLILSRFSSRFINLFSKRKRSG